MMSYAYSQRRVTVSLPFVLYLCTLTYFDPYGIAMPFLLAAALHELGHCAVLLAFRIPIYSLRIGVLGARLSAGYSSRRAEILVTAGGPAVNLICVPLFMAVWPTFSLCSLFLLMYNLLPIYPLDGGALLRLLLFGRCLARVAEALAGAAVLLLLARTALHLRGSLGAWPLFLLAAMLTRFLLDVKTERVRK